MLVSLNWIKKFTKIDVHSDELLKIIGSKLAEVESTENLKDKYNGILVAEIKEAKEHPDADKLGIYKVDTKKEVVQVVAGDKTLKVGDKVAYIAPGLIVPASFGGEAFTIEKRSLRGYESNGMLASSSELDWGTDHSGVLKLDTDKPAGTSLVEAYELDDTIIEIENKTLTHRPDCFGVIGFAREVAGILGNEFKSPKTSLLSEIEKSNQELDLSIAIKTDDCLRYVGLVMDNVQIKPSPQIIQSYLARVGVRPVNNVVDVTNYFAIETAQPLHAFDYSKVENLSKNRASIVVRTPKAEETINLLDGREVKPREQAVLICTDQTPIAIGGVMGGANSEVDENTKTIVLESANFDMYSIRRTSMAHGIFSEAVTRFIRGQDPQKCEAIAVEAAKMIASVSGAKIASDIVDIYPKPREEKQIKVSVDFINSRLGSNYQANEIVDLLNNVELNARVEDGKISLKPPTFRRDLNIAEDIVEEVGRLKGYDDLDFRLPTRTISAVKRSGIEKLVKEARSIMYRSGSNEVLTFNFLSEKDFRKSNLSTDKAFRIRNSISPDLQLMRTTILPSLVDKIHANIKLGYDQFSIFEINKSHSKDFMEDDLPIEDLTIAQVFASSDKVRTEKDFGSAYYQSKYALDYLLSQLGAYRLDYVELSEVNDPWVDQRSPMFDKNRTAVVIAESGPIAVVGEFREKIHRGYKLPNYVSAFELNLRNLVSIRDQDPRYLPMAKYPSTTQDVTFELDDAIKSRDVLNEVAKSVVSIEDMQNYVALVDIYKKNDDKKSLTFSIEMRHQNHTLTSAEASEIVSSAIKAVEEKFKAKTT